MKAYGVIMAGGGGTRFWPLSRHAEPKQLLNLSGKDRMINETIDRISLICEKTDIFVVTNVDQVSKMKTVTEGRLTENHILSEPCARNTAACIGYAAMEIVKKYGNGIMCIFPSDHSVQDWDAFACTIHLAQEVAENEDCLLTLGIRPTYPSTGYGYIRYNLSGDENAYPVLTFKEKPALSVAKEYVKSGDYVWNSGMFIWKASVILSHFEKLLPEVHSCLVKIGEAMNTSEEKDVLQRIYPTIPSISIDYGILEKSTDVKVIPADMGWDDVGSWDNLGVLHPSDENGNIFVGKHVAIDTKDCVTYSGKRLIATLGVQDLIIVETEDAILVCDKKRAQEVKRITDVLKERGDNCYL